MIIYLKHMNRVASGYSRHWMNFASIYLGSIRIIRTVNRYDIYDNIGE
jgi:hypothetical protein